MSWDKLSMADRANYIKLAVLNGISNLSHIKAAYNQYAEGGDSNAGNLNTRLELERKVPYWKAMDNIKFKAIPDTTFTRDKTGAGSIEFFSKDRPHGITYNNGYYLPHPMLGENAILYNPSENDWQDVRLDALHGMPLDATYDVLNTLYRNAAKGTDVEWNARNKRKEDLEKYGKADSYENYFNNEADGLLRNMFIEGTPEYIESRRYYPNKQELKEWNKPLLPYIDAIQKYLETGVKPNFVLPEIIVTP